MDIIYSGYLIKQGGEGHQYKNERRRWFVLKDFYLFYYTSPPSPTKNMLNLKGFIYLDQCETKDNDSRHGTFILKSPFKEYILISISENHTSDILAWRNSLDYSIEQTKSLKENTPLEGWLQKKGGIGHNYQNWKSRYFILQGNLLFYYSDETKYASMKSLKGFIEIAHITDIDSDVTSDGNGFHFVISVNNDKSYILSTKELEIKKTWVNTLRQRIRSNGKLNLQSSLNVLNNEKIVKSGKLLRNIDLKKRKENYFVLTNVNLRVYGSKVDLTTLPHNWAKGMIECIPLLGCTVQFMDGSEETQYISNKEMAVIDIQAHAYLLEADNEEELKDWVKVIKETSRELAKQIIRAGETIRLTCNAFDKNNISAGYTILTLDRNKMTLKYLMLKKDVVIPFSQLKLVYLQQTYLFCLKYVQSDKAKQLKMKCRNAIGIFDAVEAIFEESGSRSQFKKNGNALRHESYVNTDKTEVIEQSNKRMTKEMFLKNRKTMNEQDIDEMKSKAAQTTKPKKKKGNQSGGRKKDPKKPALQKKESIETIDQEHSNETMIIQSNPGEQKEEDDVLESPKENVNISPRKKRTKKRTKTKKEKTNEKTEEEEEEEKDSINNGQNSETVEEENEEKSKEINKKEDEDYSLSYSHNDNIKKILNESSHSIVINKEESKSHNPLFLPVLKPLREPDKISQSEEDSETN